jgi:hypothetical protein
MFGIFFSVLVLVALPEPVTKPIFTMALKVGAAVGVQGGSSGSEKLEYAAYFRPDSTRTALACDPSGLPLFSQIEPRR